MEHLLRLIESLSDPSYELRVVAACYIGAYFLFIISSHFQLSGQSHHISFPFDVQSYVFILTFRVVFSFCCSEPHLQIGVQSRRLSLVRHSEPSSLFSIWCSELYFYFDVRSRILILAFRVAFSVWHLESLFVFSSTFEAIMSLFRLAFRAVFSF